jgi:tetratricopeptide (TPR) repeat protein
MVPRSLFPQLDAVTGESNASVHGIVFFRSKTSVATILAIIAIVILGILALPVVLRSSDIPVYHAIAIDAFSIHPPGAIPATLTWYPPVTTVLFGIINALTTLPFGVVWTASIVVLAAGAVMFCHRRYGEADAAVVATALASSFLLLGSHIAFSRFDIFVGGVLLLGFVALRKGKWTDAIVFFSLAGNLKLLPFILLPLVFALSPRKEWLRLVMVFLITMAAAAVLCLLLLGMTTVRGWFQEFFTFHASRGFQVESTWSSIWLTIGALRRATLSINFHHFAFHNDSIPFFMRYVAAGTGLLGAAVLLIRAFISRTLTVEHSALPLLLWILVTSTVFSTGYFIWALPALLFALISSRNHWRLPSYVFTVAALLIAALLTRVLYPTLYKSLVIDQSLLPVLVLTFRNVLLLVLIWLFASARWISPPEDERSAIQNTPSESSTPTPAEPISPSSSARLINWFSLMLCAALIVSLGIFKIMDRDFWWHITAGKLMVHTGSLISVEPFAYTREGLRYVATHEWLAQIILYFVHALGGSTGIILFRTLMGLTIAALLFSICRRPVRWTAPFIVLVMATVRPELLERPQIFTFLIFVLFLLLAFHYLDSPSGSPVRQRLMVAIPLLSILWTNLHGAASLIGCGVIGLVWLQEGWSLYRDGRLQKTSPERREWFWLTAALVAAAGALFVHPDGLRMGSYIISLFTDQTTSFIREWAPRDLGDFIRDFWPLLTLAVLAVRGGRRTPVFSIGLLLSLLLLSRTAVRHEPLLALALGAVTLWQCSHWTALHEKIATLERMTLRSVLVTMLVLGFVSSQVIAVSNLYAEQDHLWGLGAFTPARGAYDFLEREKIQGRMFNTYGIGGYLMFRGYPTRKVYIDGRNVDYGLSFMFRTFQAGKDPAAWKQLEETYGFTYALIDFNVVRTEGNISYARHLDTNPAWALVYVDDWVAVYLKHTTANDPIIKRLQYRHLTPHLLESNTLASQTKEKDVEATIGELQRVIADNPEGIKGRIELGKLLLKQGKVALARSQAMDAIAAQPRRAEPYELLAAIALTEGNVHEAADYFITMLRYVGKNYPDLNMERITSILEEGGHPWRAVWLRMLAGISSSQEVNNPQTTEAAQAGSGTALDLNFAPDIERAINEGISYAENKDFTKAKDAFLRALAWDPSRATTLSNLCALMIEMNDLDAARDYCERALKNEKNSGDIYYNLAVIAIRQHRLSDARTAANQAKRLGRDTSSLTPFLKP